MKRSPSLLLIVGFMVALVATIAEAQVEAKKDPQPRGRYVVAAAGGEGFVMVDQTTGRSWMLEYSADDKPVWLPIDRIDDPEAAEAWREKRDAEWQQTEEQEKEDTDKRRQVEMQQIRLRMLFRKLSAIATEYHNARAEHLLAIRDLGESAPRTKFLRSLVDALDNELRDLIERLDNVEKKRDQLPGAGARPNDGVPAKTALDDLRELLNDVEQRLDEQPAAPVESAGLAAMKRELFPLLLEEEMLLQTHGATHPKVQEIRQRIELTRQFLEETASRPSDAPVQLEPTPPPLKEDKTGD